jgi:hypothetical protein
MIRKITILAGFIIAIGLSACDKNFELGGNILPSDDFLDIQITDTVAVKLYTENSPHLITSSPQYLLIGNYEDPDFGTTSASFFLQLSQYSYPDWGDSVIFDSICLGLPLAEDPYKYGGTNQPLELQVLEVSDTLKQIYYYSDENPNDYTDGNVIGQGLTSYFTAYDTDTSATENKDTLGLLVRLSDSLGQEFIDNADAYFFNYSERFYNIFFGIYVKATNDNFGIYKIRNSVNTKTKNFGLIIFYHFPNSPSESRRFVIPFVSSNVKFNIFSHDYSNSDFPEIEDTTTQLLRDKAYLQAMSGTVIRLEAPGLANLDSIIINKAELILKVEENSQYPENDQLWFVGYDTTKSLVYFDDFNYNTYQGATLYSNEYHFIITRIIQEEINNFYKKNGIKLYITDLNSNFNFQRCIINNGVGLNSSPTKLIITYTKVH